LLIFVKIQVKLTDYDGMTKRSAAILNVSIMQGSAVTQLR